MLSQGLAGLATNDTNGASMLQFGCQQHGQLVGMMALACVVAAVLERPPPGRQYATERLFPELDAIGRLCSQHMIMLSRHGSRSPLPPWFRTVGGFILTYAVSCARLCAACACQWPL